MSQLNICEIYPTIHGESSLAGTPCTIVRCQGCSKCCTWCDSRFARLATQGQKMSFAEISQKVAEIGLNHILISGGEPLEQVETPEFLSFLHQQGYQLMLETNGTESIINVPKEVQIVMDIKCPSSNIHRYNRYENLDLLKPNDEIKFVIQDYSDFTWAQETIAKYQLFTRFTVLFSCVFSQLSPKNLVDWVLQFGGQGRVQLQLHKFIWPPETRGV